MLSRARFRDNSLLPHSAREEDLAKGVVDLVRAGVAEVLALEVDFRAAQFLGQPLREIEGRCSSGVLMKRSLELFTKARVSTRLRIGSL